MKETTVDLTSASQASVAVPVACANLRKAVPNASSTFDIQASPQSADLQNLMMLVGKRMLKQETIQVAVWIVTDSISREELDSRYVRSTYVGSRSTAASDEDVIAAMRTVEEAGIDLRAKEVFRERISLIRGLTHETRDVRQFCENGLGLASADVPSWLLALLGSAGAPPSARRDAIKALANMREPRAVEPLISTLKDQLLGANAILALGRIGDPRAVEPLIELLNGPGDTFAMEALGEIPARSAGCSPSGLMAKCTEKASLGTRHNFSSGIPF